MTSLENVFRNAYSAKRVLVTGHTGFKGSWLTLWLNRLGAEVTGFALAPDTHPSLFEAARVKSKCVHTVGDVRELGALTNVLDQCKPDYIFHMAAQPLVRLSYIQPLETLQTNFMGTAHLLEAVRLRAKPCAVVVVTSDKCYENKEWIYGYREDEPMGGRDVYSMSKGATELLVSSYRRSFFDPQHFSQHGIALATARAGNVIGGGDWASDRIVPDAVRALTESRPVVLRNPTAIRPWQHVLEPIGGYLQLGARLGGSSEGHPQDFCESWNFGPPVGENHCVDELVEEFVKTWGAGSWTSESRSPEAGHEAHTLTLSIEKATSRLHWRPQWDFRKTIYQTARWYRSFYSVTQPVSALDLCVEQIGEYTETLDGCHV